MARRAIEAAATPQSVRVVMTKSMPGSEDGLRVQLYEKDGVYVLGPSLAQTFLKIGAAKPAPDDKPDGGTNKKKAKGPDENK